MLYTGKWLLFWFIAMGTFLFLLKPNGINYVEKFYLTTPFFLLVAIIFSQLFKFKEYLVQIENRKLQFNILIIIFIIFVISPSLIDRFLPLSESYQQHFWDKKMLFFLFRLEASLTKLADVIFQQTLIFGLVFYLKEKLKSDRETIKFFTLVFFALHTPLFIEFQSSSLIFTLPSLIGGLCFVIFYLKTKHGLLYAFSTHFAYYIGTGIIFRLI